jgi:hypothetical protein
VIDEQPLVYDPWSVVALPDGHDAAAYGLPRLAPPGDESAPAAPAEASEDAVAIYLREIGRRHLLSVREERELGRCVEDGRVLDDTALQVVAAGGVVGGAGFGVAFLGALRALSAAIPADHRAAVMSAFYVVAYVSISVPAVVAGLLVTPLGLEATFEWFGAIVAALALVVAAEAWRTRPRATCVSGSPGWRRARGSAAVERSRP